MCTMTDSCQNKAISSACIGSRVYVNEDKHGIFVPLSETLQLSDVEQNISSSFSNDTMHLKKELARTEHLNFTFDLSNGKIDSHSDDLVNFNKTFCVGLGNNAQEESCENPISETILYRDTNHPILESACLAEESACIQLDSEKLAVLDKTINLTTLKYNCMPERNGFSRLDSEESLGIIPEVLESSCELLDSAPMLNDDKENYANEAVISEVFFPSNQNYCNLNKRCLLDLNIPLKSCANNERCTSTPKQLNNYIDLNSPLMFFSQDKYNFQLQEGEKVDEPIIAGSNQTATPMCFDEMEFDRGKILTSTSKLSSLQIHSPDLLSKTSVLNFKCNEISGVNNKNLNTRRTLKDAVEVSDCENSETRAVLPYTNILNDTFEVKPAIRYSQGVLDGNCLGESPNLPQNSITINKTITVENTFEILDDTITSSNSETNCHKNHTMLLNCQSNATVSEIIKNQSQDLHLSKCPDTERISLCKRALNSKNYISRRETISLPIKRSVNSFKTRTDTNSLSNIDTCLKNGETQTEQSTKFLNRRSSSAFPTLQKPNSLKLDTFKKPGPVSSNLNNLHRSKLRPSISKTKNVETEIQKPVSSSVNSLHRSKLRQSISKTKNVETEIQKPVSSNVNSLHRSRLRQSISKTKHVETEIPKKSIKAPNATYLPKPMKTIAYVEIKRSEIACKNSNSVPLKVKAMQPKKVKSNEITSIKVPSQTKTIIKTSLNDTFITNQVNKGNVKSACEFLNSNGEANKSDKNLTFSASESCDEINTKVPNYEKFEMPGEILSNSHELQTELPVTSVTETANEESLKHKVVLHTENDTKTSSDDCFVGNDISKQLSFKNEKIEYHTDLNSHPIGKHVEDKNLTFSASETVEVKNSETADEIFSNQRNIEIKESSSDDCVTEIGNEDCLKSREIQALSVIKNDIFTQLSCPEDSIKSDDTFINPHFILNSFEKESNQTIYCDKETVTINKEDTFEIPCEISSKSLNDKHLVKRKIDTVSDVLAKEIVDIPNDSRVKISKCISEKSNLECKNKNSVSLKGLVKGLFSRNVKSRMSLMPARKYNISNESSESNDPCTSKCMEGQDPSRILSKQNSRSIQIPKCNLKSSSGNSKEITRCQEKSLQKENHKSNSVPLETKNTVLKAFQSDNGKFCQGERNLKPLTEKAAKVLTSGIPKRSRIPFAAHQQLQASQSQRVR